MLMILDVISCTLSKHTKSIGLCRNLSNKVMRFIHRLQDTFPICCESVNVMIATRWMTTLTISGAVELKSLTIAHFSKCQILRFEREEVNQQSWISVHPMPNNVIVSKQQRRSHRIDSNWKSVTGS